jgi:hypothetical protein
LKEKFGGRAITEQNLSKWKQCGHPAWVQGEEVRAFAADLSEQAKGLEEAGPGLHDSFASVLTARLVHLAMRLADEAEDPEKQWAHLCGALRQLSRVRRDDHRSVRVGIAQDRWERQVQGEELAEIERMKEEGKKKIIDKCYSEMDIPAMAEAFGGGRYGKVMAEMLHRIKFDMPLDDLLENRRQKAEGAEQVASGECRVTGKTQACSTQGRKGAKALRSKRKSKSGKAETGKDEQGESGAEDAGQVASGECQVTGNGAPNTKNQPPEKLQTLREARAANESKGTANSRTRTSTTTRTGTRENPTESNLIAPNTTKF